MGKVRVWDLPTRLFHWMLVLLVLIAWRSAETRDISRHVLAGSGVAGLLVFRLWWGFFGSSTARFANFIKGPGAVLAYARSLFTHNDPELGQPDNHITRSHSKYSKRFLRMHDKKCCAKNRSKPSRQ